MLFFRGTISSKVNSYFPLHNDFFVDKEWIQKTIAQNDKDGDGGISLEEFIEMNIRGKVSSETKWNI